jgi:hypothetical protein
VLTAEWRFVPTVVCGVVERPSANGALTNHAAHSCLRKSVQNQRDIYSRRAGSLPSWVRGVVFDTIFVLETHSQSVTQHIEVIRLRIGLPGLKLSVRSLSRLPGEHSTHDHFPT